MPLSPAAEIELRQMLRDFRAAHAGAVVPTSEGKALEAWVLFKLAHMVRQNMPTWTVSLRRGDGSLLPPGVPFDLPSQRSRIQPSNPTAPGFILLEQAESPSKRVELHTSLQWKGRSDAKHEIDVSALPASIGTAIRTHGGGNPRGLPLVAVECKDKEGSGTLDETRQTLARMYDLALVTQPTPGWSCRIYETQTHTNWGRRSSRYVGFFSKGTFAIVRAGAFQSGARQLAYHYSIQHRPTIYVDALQMTGLQASFRATLESLDSF